MAVRVGLDLVEVAAVDDELHTHGERYLRRVYTRDEREECGMDPKRLAARFAAKEATMKVLDAEPLPWGSIEVLSGPQCQLRVVLHGEARESARRTGIERLSVSVAATRARATAIVIGEVAA
jgi:holo-[acyl-carrier protein] synthase